MVYDFGGIYDYLEDIHFPKAGAGQFPPWVSQPWYWWMERQTPTYFSYLAPPEWGDGWAARELLPIIRILPIDTQKEVPTEPVGATGLDDAADTYVKRWDAKNPLAVEFFGRINFSDKFFWTVLGRKFPKWASSLDGLATNRPNDPNPPIGPYIEKAVTDYFGRWNSDSAAYRQVANSIPGDGAGWLPLQQHSFNVPFPHPTPREGGSFAGLTKQLDAKKGWFGPIPASAWTNFNILNTQSYAFHYGFGQLDAFEWDLSAWPPRRTSVAQRDGGSKNPPSAISGKWGGGDPFIDFIDHQFLLVG